MSKAARGVLFGAGIVIGLFALIAMSVGLFFDLNGYKPEIVPAVKKSTGTELKINGKAEIFLFPRFGVALNDVHLSFRGSELFAASEVKITPHFAWPIHGVRIRSDNLSYQNQRTRWNAHLKGVDVNIMKFTHGAKSQAGNLNSIAFHGNFRADSLEVGALRASNLNAEILDDYGLFHLQSTKMNVFGEDIRGNAQIDIRGPIPKLEIMQRASHIDLNQIPMNGVAKIFGFAEAFVSLIAAGKDAKTILKTAKGKIFIHGRNITLVGVDLDNLAIKLKIGQGLDLINIGFAPVSGPLAQALGQIARFSGAASESKTVIHNLVSDWMISGGVAEAKNVAFSTAKTSVAFRGGLNFIRGRYQNFYMATVDPKGCSMVKVKIVGPLREPRPSASSVGEQISKSYPGQLSSKIGSMGSLIGEIFQSKENPKPKAYSSARDAPSSCDHFYPEAAIRNE